MKMLTFIGCISTLATALTLPNTEDMNRLRFTPDDYEFLESDEQVNTGSASSGILGVEEKEENDSVLNVIDADASEIASGNSDDSGGTSSSPSSPDACPTVNERQVNAGVKPKYELNPDLFITPVYIWGPSSQLQGLREAIGVAIRLNRTLLLPPFLTHQTDSSGGDNPVPVDIRLDIPKLRELLSIGFTDDLQCRQSDVVFLARGIYNKPTDPSVMMERVKRIENFEKATSMKVIRRNEETNDIDEKSPFLERSIPVTRSPKVSGAGVQLS
jgi:hypothetical protein